MAWAIVYSATILAAAYALPRIAGIWAQYRFMQQQVAAAVETSSSGQTEIDWEEVLGSSGGGYA